MKKNPPPTEPGKRGAPTWNFLLWYLPLMLLLLWMWQGAFGQFSVQTIPYSQFKQHLAAGEVVEVAVRETEITGSIRTNAVEVAEPAGAPATEQAPPPPAVAEGEQPTAD
ncbi:MAG: ATP-dependent metallopeptidase FtsH/Yme1/Tma family protein, partial [Limisphaerales bacterium]